MGAIDELEAVNKEIEALKEKAKELKAEGKKEAIETVKALIKEYGITMTSLRSVLKPQKKRSVTSKTNKGNAVKK